MGAQKNHLNETVLLSIQTFSKTDGLENIYNFTLKLFVYLNPCFIKMNSLHARVFCLLFLSSADFLQNELF